MRTGLRAVAWVIWACKRYAYLFIDRYEKPRRETAGAFLLLSRDIAGGSTLVAATYVQDNIINPMTLCVSRHSPNTSILGWSCSSFAREFAVNQNSRHKENGQEGRYSWELLRVTIISSATRLCIAFLTATVLVACGGGDEGGIPTPPPSSGNPPANPGNSPPVPGGVVLTPSTMTVNVSASNTERGKADVADLTLQGVVPLTPLFVAGSHTQNAITSAVIEVAETRVRLVFQLKDPFQATPGTFSDTVTLRACRQTPCTSNVADSFATVTVNYTITAPANPPAIALQPSSLSVEGFLLHTSNPPLQQVDIAFTDISNSTAPFVTVTSSNSAVSSAVYERLSGASGPAYRLSIGLKAPSQLGIGVYNDVVNVRACLDPDCRYEMMGSPAILPVRYTVSNTVSGPKGYTARTIATTANDVVWDSGRQVLYLSMAARSANNSNTIGVLDPVSGTFTAYAGVGADPGPLALSPDGQYLYVGLRGSGEIQRLLLPSLASDLIVPLGTRGSDGAQLYARELHVSPGAPRTIGVVRTVDPLTSSGDWDMAIFDDALMRGAPIGGAPPGAPTRIQWESASRIFGVGDSSKLTAFQISVYASGPEVTSYQNGVGYSFGRAWFVNGRMYLQNGKVFDPLTFAQIGMYSPSSGCGPLMIPDASSGRAFFLHCNQLSSFELLTFSNIETILLPNADPLHFRSRMVRWGHDGLALLNYRDGREEILLLNGPFVRP